MNKMWELSFLLTYIRQNEEKRHGGGEGGGGDFAGGESSKIKYMYTNPRVSIVQSKFDLLVHVVEKI